MLTAVLQVWRRSLAAAHPAARRAGRRAGRLVADHRVRTRAAPSSLGAVRWSLAAQGASCSRSVLGRGPPRDRAVRRARGPAGQPDRGLLVAAVLTMLAYPVSRPIARARLVATARRTPSRSGWRWSSSASWCWPPGAGRCLQLIGFLVLDNGIATVAFLTAGGVPVRRRARGLPRRAARRR